MKHLLMQLATAAALFSLLSCEKKEDFFPEQEQTANLNILINSGKPETRAADVSVLDGEKKLNSLDILVYDAESSSSMYQNLEIHQRLEASDISANGETSLQLKVSPGKKHIYALANCNTLGDLSNCLKEADFLRKKSQIKLNTLTSFLMVGSGTNITSDGKTSYEPLVVAGKVNTININLRRLACRIKIGEITAEFDSPYLKTLKAYVRRVFLVHVPKEVLVVNGSTKDVFGVDGKGLEAYPDGIDRNGKKKFYSYPLPDKNISGFLNFGTKDNSSFTPDSDIASLTLFTLGNENEGLLQKAPNSQATELPNHTLSLNKYFYSYPNSTPLSEDLNYDYTTKFVIELVVCKDANDKASYFYPISIPYTEPNYAYTINKVTLHRLGSKTPFSPVTTSDCSFEISVEDWESGNIISKFNNPESGENFVF